jgi:hypothetical protein
MAFDTPSLLRRLHELEREVAESTRQWNSLQTARRDDDRATAMRAADDAERHVRAMAVTTQRIKAQVVPADGMGDTLQSLSELVLRAVRMVVLAELDTLHRIVADPPAEARSRALCWGRYQGVEDMTVCVRAELEQITDQWRSYRGTAAIERDAYRCALRQAHAATRALATISDFARFLDRGLTRSDWPGLQATCARILVALNVSIDVDPNAPMLVVSWPIHGHMVDGSAS